MIRPGRHDREEGPVIGRIATWLFYAIVFFMLGAWAGPRLPAIGDLAGRGVDVGMAGIDAIQRWALGGGESAPAAQPAAQPAQTPAATPAEAAVASAARDAARQAYGEGDFDRAIAAYRALVAATPDDLDLRGELGNVLYATGRLPEAAHEYAEVATRLVDAGFGDRAAALLPAIRAGDPALADALKTRIGAP